MPFPREGPKEWSPNRTKQILKGLEDLTVDTSNVNTPSRILSVADIFEEKTLESHFKLKSLHVADDPEATRKVIESGDLSTLRNNNRYMCAGLYVNLYPMTQSKKKWEFLDGLTKGQKANLQILVLDALEDVRGRYITEHEWHAGMRYLKDWVMQDNIQILLILAGQPYNIPIDKIAEEKMGLKPFRPYVVPVTFEGRYLEYNIDSQWFSIELAERHLGMKNRDVDMEHLCRTWKDLGWDGAFTKESMGGVAGLVIWNPARILSFGESERMSGRLSGSSGRGEGGTIQEGRRFETSLSPNHEMAILQEIGNPSRMFGPMRYDAVVELRELLYQLLYSFNPEQGRFKADLSQSRPSIIDTQIYRRIPDLSDQDLSEMDFLLEELARSMA